MEERGGGVAEGDVAGRVRVGRLRPPRETFFKTRRVAAVAFWQIGCKEEEPMESVLLNAASSQI